MQTMTYICCPLRPIYTVRPYSAILACKHDLRLLHARVVGKSCTLPNGKFISLLCPSMLLHSSMIVGLACSITSPRALHLFFVILLSPQNLSTLFTQKLHERWLMLHLTFSWSQSPGNQNTDRSATPRTRY